MTCAKTYVHCPGHIGHIELDVPVSPINSFLSLKFADKNDAPRHKLNYAAPTICQVYNPLLFPAMYSLLRTKCMYCHKYVDSVLNAAKEKS